MSYTTPPLAAALVLQGGYGTPALSVPVVLTDGGPLPGGTLDAALPPPLPPVAVVFSGAMGYAGALAGTVAAAIPPALASGEAITGYVGPLAVSVAPPALPVSAVGAGEFDVALPDNAAAATRAPHGHAPAASGGASMAHAQALPAQARAAAAHASTLPAGTGAVFRHQDAYQSRRPASVGHQHGIGRRHGASFHHADTLRTRRPVTAPHQSGIPTRVGASLRHADTIVHRPARRLDWRRSPLHARRLANSHHQAIPASVRQRTSWQQGMEPRPGRWWPTYEPPGLRIVIPGPTGYTPRPLRCPVILGPTLVAQPPCSGGGEEPGTVVVPVLEHYLVINTVTLVRADTGEPVEVANLSASLDRESWCWGWSASLAADQLDLVRSPALGEHVELIATLNGISLRLVVERIARNRQFPAATLRIGGRGRAAWLAAPHSPVQTRYNTEARTAQQLANDALTYNGVAIGWSVDWRLTDWLVPAGAWSHRGTYMEAVQRIAEAGGAYVQAHNTDQQLIIQPHYPTPPWEWASQTPDIELPEDVCEVEDIEQEDKPAYNAVYVIGGAGGRRDRIRRAGMAANIMAPDVIDPLATAPEMTRQRGIAVLGDTGRQEHISLRLPVLDETGIILPGTLIKYVEGGAPRVGLSRGVALDHRFPELWQTVRIETHVL